MSQVDAQNETKVLFQLEAEMVEIFADYVTMKNDTKISDCNKAYYKFRDQMKVLRKTAEEMGKSIND